MRIPFRILPCGSAMGNENLWLFISHCTRLALPLDKIGGGSAMGNENLWLFISHCTRLALPLQQKK